MLESDMRTDRKQGVSMSTSFMDAELASLLKDLASQGDNLPKLERAVDWEGFRPHFEGLYRQERHGGERGGRPPVDCVRMFKVLVLQSLHGLSDERMQFMINDRASFRGFLGMGMSERAPDANTIWLFRQRLEKRGLLKDLFAAFWSQMEARGVRAEQGQLLDSSIVEVPRQRNTREENRCIKGGGEPPDWGEAKRRQKDTDARWAKKGNETYYGYKNHVCVDRKNKLICRYEVTSASVHDSQVAERLLSADNSSRDVWADAAYCGKALAARLSAAGYRSHIHRKARAGKPLTERSREANRKRSRVRARVEHVFAAQGRALVRTVGIKRAQVQIGLRNLVYNMRRFAWLTG